MIRADSPSITEILWTHNIISYNFKSRSLTSRTRSLFVHSKTEERFCPFHHSDTRKTKPLNSSVFTGMFCRCVGNGMVWLGIGTLIIMATLISRSCDDIIGLLKEVLADTDCFWYKKRKCKNHVTKVAINRLRSFLNSISVMSKIC